MVRLLVLIEVLDIISFYVARPLQVEQVGVLAGLNHFEARGLARVDDCIVDVS